MQPAETNRLIAFAGLLLAAFVLAYVGGWLLKPAFADRERPDPMDHDRMSGQTSEPAHPSPSHSGHPRQESSR